MVYALGIDLGTTSLMAAAYRDGEVEPVRLGSDTFIAPAITEIRGSESFQWVSGPMAERGNPLAVFRHAKRHLGRDPRSVAGVEVLASDVIGHQLAWVLSRCKDQMDEAPSHVTFTNPADWGAVQIEEFHHVTARLGDAGIGYLAEPEAAANYFAAHSFIPPDHWLAVFDLGGGTTDVSLLHKLPDRFELAPESVGNPSFGGRDLTEALIDYLRSSRPELAGWNDISDEGLLAAITFARSVRWAKEQLSDTQNVQIDLPWDPPRRTITLSRAELNDVLRPMVDSAVDLIIEALDQASVREDQLHGVLLAGGGSRMPLVGQRIAQELGLTPLLAGDPKHMVGMGAAIVSGAVLARKDPPAPVKPTPAAIRPRAADTIQVDLNKQGLSGGSDSDQPVSTISRLRPTTSTQTFRTIGDPSGPDPAPIDRRDPHPVPEPPVDRRVIVLAVIVLALLAVGVLLVRLTTA